MRNQDYLQVLKGDIEAVYVDALPPHAPKDVEWVNDTWLDLAATLNNDVIRNSHKYAAWVIKKRSKLLPEEFLVSDKTLKRIFQSGEKDKNGKYYEEYNVEEPIRPIKRRILDILSQFVNCKDWNDYILKNSEINGIWSAIRTQVEYEFNSFKAYTLQTKRYNKDYYGRLLDTYQYLIMFFIFECGFFYDHDWTFQTPDNESSYEIVELSFLTPVMANGRVSLLLGITFNLQMYSLKTFKFIEEVIIQTTDRITLEKENDKWQLVDIIRWGGRWIECSWYKGPSPGPEDLMIE